MDHDNHCGNYLAGKPENVFWTSAPRGRYRVQVNYYRACSGTPHTVSCQVRVVRMGEVRTYTGMVSNVNDTDLVATLDIN